LTQNTAFATFAYGGFASVIGEFGDPHPARKTGISLADMAYG
jgi:hypothetical protein